MSFSWPKLGFKDYRKSSKKRRRGSDRREEQEEFPVFREEELSGADALSFYQQYQCLHVRGKANTLRSVSPLNLLRDLWRERSDIVEENWCVENGGSDTKALSARTLLGGKETGEGGGGGSKHLPYEESFYCSTILQKDDSFVNDQFLARVPVESPRFFEDGSFGRDLYHSKPVWLFFGQNMAPEGVHVEGRAEHTDSVSHSGTWHYQLSGEKHWHIRPLRESEEWDASIVNHHLDKNWQNGFTIICKPGDLLLINTRLWWHRTTFPNTLKATNRLCVSYARDFFSKASSKLLLKLEIGAEEEDDDEEEVEEEEGEGDDGMLCGVCGDQDDKKHEDTFQNVEGLYASKAVKKGHVILTESELPDCSLPRSTRANCEVVELENGEGALVALCNIKAGDFLAVLPSDSDDDDDENDDDDDDEEEEEHDDEEEEGEEEEDEEQEEEEEEEEEYVGF